MAMYKRRMTGFSLGELLVVVTIIVILAMTVILTYRHQVEKARDATRKEHFNKYKTAFEDYYNDYNCYPTQAKWDECTCDSNCLAPYLDKFLCDPTTKQHYYYYPFTNAAEVPDTCMGYRLYAKLENNADPDIARVGCGVRNGCGEGVLAGYNYGISMGGPLTAAGFVADNGPVPPTPTTTPIPGSNFCLGGQEGKLAKDIVCNQKTGCVPSDPTKRACADVLIQDYECQGFADSSECTERCQADYDTNKCPETETLECAPWRFCR